MAAAGDDPDVDVVGICSPTFLHKEMALAAIAAGKHVLCEKPLSLSARDAEDMALAAERAGVKSLVGFNYMKNPATQLAKQMIESGEIGEIVHFRGAHNEDYLMDPSIPMSWRLKKEYASEAGRLATSPRTSSISRIISADPSPRSSATARRSIVSVRATKGDSKPSRTTTRPIFC